MGKRTFSEAYRICRGASVPLGSDALFYPSLLRRAGMSGLFLVAIRNQRRAL